MSSTEQRVVVVTGAGKGLGRAYALHLAQQGIKVIVNNRRHPGEADNDTSAMKTVTAITRLGGIAAANYADVTQPDSGTELVNHALDTFGALHGIVANAGMESVGRFEEVSTETFQQVFNTGFFGNLYLVRAAWTHWLTTGGGRAVLTTSGAGLYGNHGQAAYSAAKAAVIGLVRSLALEGQSRNIKINAVAPYAYTAMTQKYLKPSERERLSPAKVAPLIASLLSEACSVNGEVLVSAGGLLRKAITVEGEAMPSRPEIQETLKGLGPSTTFRSANESFAHLNSLITSGSGNDNHDKS